MPLEVEDEITGIVHEFPGGTNPAVIKGALAKARQASNLPSETKASKPLKPWYDRPGYEFLIPESVRRRASDITQSIAESPIFRGFTEEVSKGPVGTFVRGTGRAADILINKPIDYLFARPGGQVAGKVLEKTAPYTLPRILGLETATTEEDIAAGEKAAKDVREGLNLAAPFFIAPAARATGIGKFFPKAAGARAAAEQRAAAAINAAEEEVATGQKALLMRSEEADRAANALRFAEQRASSAKAVAESTPVVEADPTVRALSEELDFAKRVAENARIRLEKAENIATAIPKQATAALEGQTVGALKPIETGPAFKESFAIAKTAAGKEVNTAYGKVTNTEIGERVIDTTPVFEAADTVLSQYGLTRKIFPTRAQTAATRLKGRGTEGKSADVLLAEDAFYQEAKPILDARQAAFRQGGKSPAVPVDLYNTLVGDARGKITIKQAIADRQRVRAYKRAAEDTGDRPLARDLRQLEEGFTEAIHGAGDDVKSLIKAADKAYAEDYLPFFGFKAPGSKVAEKAIGITKERQSAVDVTEAIFPKKSTRGVDTSTETARRVAQSIGPQATSAMGRVFLKKRIEEIGGDLEKLQKSFSGYNPETLDIALGGSKARKEIEEVFDAFSKANREIVSAKDALKIADEQAKAVGKTLGAKETEVSNLFKARAEARADIAASDVKLASETATLAGKETEKARRGVTQAEKELERIGKQVEFDLKRPYGVAEKAIAAVSRPHPFIGGIMLVEGVARGNYGRAILGGFIMNGNGLSTLLSSPKGRSILKGLSATTRGSPKALLYASQANALINASESD